MFKSQYVEKVFNEFKNKNANMPEYLQAAEEILGSIEPLFLENKALFTDKF